MCVVTKRHRGILRYACAAMAEVMRPCCTMAATSQMVPCNATPSAALAARTAASPVTKAGLLASQRQCKSLVARAPVSRRYPLPGWTPSAPTASAREGAGPIGQRPCLFVKSFPDVVVPHGVLFRGGSEGLIRQRFIEENLLEGVIGLPANLFFGVGIPAALMFFSRSKKDKKVFFIDASREFAESKNQNRLREQDIEKIVSTWRKRKSIDKYAYLASVDELKDNEFNLNIPLYVDTFVEEAPVDLEAVAAKIRQFESDLAALRDALNQALKALAS